MDDLIVRPARPAEAPLLSQLAFESKAHWGYDAEFMRACREELTISEEELDREPSHVAEIAGQAVGFYALAHLNEEEIELEYLFVDPRVIGQGIGRCLLEHAKQIAAELGYRDLVIVGDPHAEGFYVRLGARRVGTKPSASIPGRRLPLFELALARKDT